MTYRPNFFFKTVLQVDICGRKTNLFKKCPCLFVFQRSQIEYSWMVLTAEIWEHNGIFCYCFLIFWQNNSMCSQISAVSTIQLGLNLASLKYKQTWAFLGKNCLFTRMSSWNAVLKKKFGRYVTFLVQTMKFDWNDIVLSIFSPPVITGGLSILYWSFCSK